MSNVTPIRDGQQPPGDHPLGELAALIDGKLDLDKLRTVVTHVRRCPECQSELVEVAAGASALRMASRPEVADPGYLPLPSFLDQLGVTDRHDRGGVGSGPAEAPPKGSLVVAAAKTQGQAGGVIVPMRRRRRWWMAAAAIAAVVLGSSA